MSLWTGETNGYLQIGGRKALITGFLCLGLMTGFPVKAQVDVNPQTDPAGEGAVDAASEGVPGAVPGTDPAAVIDPATGEPVSAPLPTADEPVVDGFTVTGVQVSAQGSTTGQARLQAFAEGQRIALERLAESLGGEVDFGSLSEQAIARLIQGFQVEEERVSPGQYDASLAFTFRPDEVRAVVRDQVGTATAVGSPTTIPTTGRTPTGAVLVVPVWQAADALRLWDAPNPWHDAWLNRANAADAVPIVVPFGDLQDVSELTTDQALNGDRVALQAMAERYGASQPIVATLTQQGTGYSMALDWFPPGEAPSEEIVPVASLGGASTLPQAVEEAALRIQRGPLPATLGGPQQPSLSAGPGGGESLFIVPVTSLPDWVDLRGRLDRIPAIVTTTVVSLQPGEAVVQLQTVGADAALRDQLAQQQLGLELGAEGMEIRRLRPFVAPRAPVSQPTTDPTAPADEVSAPAIQP